MSSPGDGGAIIEPAPVELVVAGEWQPLSPIPPHRASSDRPQQDPVVIEEQTFEGAAFPPEGWEVFDRSSGTQGPNIGHGWSRQACERPRDNGGDAAAWSVGGGSRGASLICRTTYREPVESELSFAGIDASNYHGGIEVRFNLWMDTPPAAQPQDEAFFACVRPAPRQAPSCRYFTPPQTRAWLELRSPLVFDNAAGRPDAELFFRYADGAPNGTHIGVFIDNVLVSGLPGAAPTDPPTPTPDGGTTPPPTVPGPTQTPPPTWTPRPTATPVPPGRVVHLPLVIREAKMDDPLAFPTAPSTWAGVEFGTNVLADGTLVDKATRFPFGVMALCSKQSWFGYPRGARLTIAWYQWNPGASRFDAIEELTQEIDTGTRPVTSASQCAEWRDAAEQRVPVPANRYKVAVFVNGAPAEAASGEAEVARNLPGVPTLTPTWTPVPTIGPSPTIRATPSGERTCGPVLVNGDFERGPSVGWEVGGDIEPRDTQRVIIEGARINLVPIDGDWLAMLGAAANGRTQTDRLMSDLFDLPDPSAIVSATLNFRALMRTEEVDNGTHEDTLFLYLVNQDNQRLRLGNTPLSEETTDPAFWYGPTTPADITQLVARRAGWTRARLMFESIHSPEATSVHIIDAVRIEICERRADRRSIGQPPPNHRPGGIDYRPRKIELRPGDVDLAVRPQEPSTRLSRP